MKQYQHILYAVDFNDDYKGIGSRAAEFANQIGAQLSLVHVLPAIETYGYPVVVDRSVEHLDFIREELKLLGEALNVPVPSRFVKSGSATTKIIQLVNELGIDLIVMGHHEHGPFKWLTGSFADAINHHSPCDVMLLKSEGHAQLDLDKVKLTNMGS